MYYTMVKKYNYKPRLLDVKYQLCHLLVLCEQSKLALQFSHNKYICIFIQIYIYRKLRLYNTTKYVCYDDSTDYSGIVLDNL